MHLYVEVLVNSRQSLRPLNELNNPNPNPNLHIFQSCVVALLQRVLRNCEETPRGSSAKSLSSKKLLSWLPTGNRTPNMAMLVVTSAYVDSLLPSSTTRQVCVYAQPQSRRTGGPPVDWRQRWTEARGIAAGVLILGGHRVKHTPSVPAQGRRWKPAKPRVDTRPEWRCAGGRMSRGGGQFVMQSLSPLPSGKSLYLAAGQQKGSDSRTPAGAITYSLRWLREAAGAPCALMCVCVRVTHTGRKSLSCHTSLPRCQAGCNSRFWISILMSGDVGKNNFFFMILAHGGELEDELFQ